MKANLYFRIFRSDTSPDRVTIDDIIAMMSDKPDEIFHQGEKIKYGTVKIEKEDNICYYVKGLHCTYIEEDIDSLVDRVLAIKPILDEHLSGYESQLSVDCHSDGQSNPEIIVTSKTMVKLASLNTRFWVDIYAYPKDGKWDYDEEKEDGRS